MISKQHRLRLKKDFEKVIREGQRQESSLFKFIYRKNNLGYVRFAVMVSKKTEKLATRRNKIKRQMRYVLSEALPDVKTKNCDLIIIVRKPALAQKLSIIKENILNAIHDLFI